MLGKGLESLIPPSKKSSDGQNTVQPSEPQSQPAEPQKPEPAIIPAETTPAETSYSPPSDLLVEPQAPLEEHLLPDAISPKEELPSAEHMYAEEKPAAPAVSPEVYKESAKPVRPSEYSAPVRSRAKDREQAIFYLDTAKIKPNEHQPRKNFDEEAIKDLANSIREFGILQPIVVTKIEREVPTGTEVEYELIAGERRLLAAKSLGMERIPAIIRHVDMERERLEMAIIENLQRENLNGVEMARAFARLQDEFRLTQREIAVRLGKSRESVANTLRLLDLPTYIQEAIGEGKITDSHGLFLLGVDDPSVQQALFYDLLAHKLTTRELRQKARILKSRTAGEQVPAGVGSEVKIFEEKLASELGAPVSIHQKGDSGKITIDFYSKEELEELVRRLGGAEE